MQINKLFLVTIFTATYADASLVMTAARASVRLNAFASRACSTTNPYALHNAIVASDLDAVKQLLPGSDLNLSNQGGETPIQLAGRAWNKLGGKIPENAGKIFFLLEEVCATGKPKGPSLWDRKNLSKGDE